MAKRPTGMVMAKRKEMSEYLVWIEYCDPSTGYHAVNVYLKLHRSGESLAEYHGKSLAAGIRAVGKKILELEVT